jgi:hypothetical protein
MIDEHKTKELLVARLKTLIPARWGWEQMELRLTEVTFHITLSLPLKGSAGDPLGPLRFRPREVADTATPDGRHRRWPPCKPKMAKT